MISELNRRQFVKQIVTTGLAAAALEVPLPRSQGQDAPKRKMTIDLVGGAIGVSVSQKEAIELAAHHGFESVEANGSFLATLSADQRAELASDMKAKKLVFGAAGLPVEFRRGEDQFAQGLKGLAAFVTGLQAAGVTRVSTWLMPCHASLPYLRNFRQHAARLREVARVLLDHQVRLGLEYVGPKTSWTSQRYTFIHTMAEMKDLIAEIGTGNVGFLLDSWHWYHAGDTVEDLLTLTNKDVVAVDLNDAPAGVPKDQQSDGKRELPCATGVIDVAAFLNALNRIGYDGPVRAEPFNKALSVLTKDEACAATVKALRQAMALVR
jgi:sugar phosphate isomerase/epimerase